jgi:hypothetical protein
MVALPTVARMPATNARFDPLTAVRWVVPVRMNAFLRSGENPSSSPVTRPDKSTPASPGADRRSTVLRSIRRSATARCMLVDESVIRIDSA